MSSRIVILVACVMSLAAVGLEAQMKGRWSGKGASHAKIKADAKAHHPGNDDERGALEGTWRATETFSDGASFDVLFTFGAGRNANSGTVVHSDELFFTASPSCFPAQGVWKRYSDRRFSATDEGFCFDTLNAFMPAGKIRFSTAVKLNAQGTEFEGTMHVEGLDVDGAVVFSDDATLSASRMRADVP